MAADKEKNHRQYDEREVYEFGFQVLLLEDKRPEEERYHYAATPDHADDANHGAVKAEAVEIDEICGREEDADEYDAPVPLEWGGALACGIPKEKQHDKHHAQLVDVVPGLDCHLVQSDTSGRWCRHEVFVVESAACTEHVAQKHEYNPFVMAEIDAFFFPTA